MQEAKRAESSPACLSGFFVLILDPQPGAGFQADQRGPDIVLIDAEYKRLVLAIVVKVADGKKVLPLLAKQEHGGDDDGKQQTAVDLLPVLEKIDARIGDPKLRFLRVEGEIALIGDVEGSSRSAGEFFGRASDVFGMVLSGQERCRRQEDNEDPHS